MLSDKYGNLTNYLVKPVGAQLPSSHHRPTDSAAAYGGWVVPNNYVSHYGQPPNGVSGYHPIACPLPKHPPYSNFAPTDRLRLSSEQQAGSCAAEPVCSTTASQPISSCTRWSRAIPYAVTVDYVDSNPYTLANPFPALPALGTLCPALYQPLARMSGQHTHRHASRYHRSLQFLPECTFCQLRWNTRPWPGSTTSKSNISSHRAGFWRRATWDRAPSTWWIPTITTTRRSWPAQAIR